MNTSKSPSKTSPRREDPPKIANINEFDSDIEEIDWNRPAKAAKQKKKKQ